MTDDRALTITVDATVIWHVLALAHLGNQEYIGQSHQTKASDDITKVIDEVRSAEKGFE